MTDNKSAQRPPVEVTLFSSEEEEGPSFTHRERVRRRLIGVALRMFSAQGYKNVKIADIVDVAGMSERTFFRYFDSKEDVLFFWVDWQQRVIKEALEQERKEQRPLRALRRSFIFLAELNERSEKKARALVKLILATPELRSRYYADHLRWHELLVSALAQGRDLSAQQGFILSTQVNIAISIYISVIKPWAYEELGSKTLPELLIKAYAALDEEVF